MDEFSAALLDLLRSHARATFAWCVLPNHYHALNETSDVLKLVLELGRLHGRTSHSWNGDEERRGRRVFYRATERYMRSERHFHATLNYVNHNPVHHRYVNHWTEWPWSSAKDYLARAGRAEAERIWREYPLGAYGEKWDDPEI
jgi:putative transposase